jgi:hypothetical protein
MPGPTLVIELAQPLSPAALGGFDALVRGLSSRCESPRPWFFDISVSVERLGGAAPGGPHARGADGHRPFLVYLMGSGAGDQSLFEAEHEDEPEVAVVLGFRPVQAVNVSAGCNDRIDHTATALLTAAVADAIGGVVKAELLDGQAPLVTGLPGVLGITEGEYPMALGAPGFLRAWAGRSGFRLLK